MVFLEWHFFPDKLTTALAINKEDLPDPDDGGFLVQLVVDLVVFYKNQLLRPANLIQEEEGDENLVSRVEELGEETQQAFKIPEVSIELYEVLCELLTKLGSIQDNLKERDADGIKLDVSQILQIADDLLELLTAYMDFTHPVFLDIERHGIFDEGKIDKLKSKLGDKLVKKRGKLKQDFDLLTKPRETEELTSNLNLIFS